VSLFQSFWFGERLTPLASACIASFVDHGHAFELYSYSPMEVPNGAVLRDAAEILPRDRVFFYSSGPGAGGVSVFSNLFRCALLLQRGGWWVDTDVVCLAADPPDDERFFGWQHNGRIGNAILRLPKGDPLAQQLFNEAEQMGRDVQWGDTGPKLLTRVVTERGLAGLAASQPFTYPLSWEHFEDTWRACKRTEVERLIQEVPFLHLWNEMFRRRPDLDLARPEPGSFLHSLFRKHGATCCSDTKIMGQSTTPIGTRSSSY
jgi:hypothetical protein